MSLGTPTSIKLESSAATTAPLPPGGTFYFCSSPTDCNHMVSVAAVPSGFGQSSIGLHPDTIQIADSPYPWAVIIAVGICCFIAGWFLARRRDRFPQ